MGHDRRLRAPREGLLNGPRVSRPRVRLRQSEVPDGHTLGWKDLTETSHPYCYNCPERILALLDPPLNDNAAEWRRLCREHRTTTRETRKAFQHGTVVRFDAPMTFRSGVVRQQFTVEKHDRKLRFRGEDGVLCQIPKVATRPFSVVAA